MGIIKFNGISSEDLGIIIQFIPSYEFPEKEYQTVSIPGRNGNLVIDNGSFKNVERTYSIAKVFKKGEKFIPSTSAIVSWLYSANGYARLEDSYEPDFYRMAIYKNDGSLSNYYDVATALEITFECKPERWLISGEKFILVNNDDKIQNPTSFDSSPVITLTTIANEDTTINIEGTEIKIKRFNEIKNLVIDCENMECYSEEDKSTYNSHIVLINNEFPKLIRNKRNTITFTNATNFKIQPRWWTL